MGEFPGEGGRIGHGNVHGSGCPGHDEDHLADGAAAGDEDAATGDGSGALNRMGTDGKGFNEGAHAEVQAVIEAAAVVHALGECAVDVGNGGGGSNEPEIGAQVVAAGSTVGASPAFDGGFGGNPIADGKIRCAFGGLHNNSGKFMAENQGGAGNEITDVKVFVVVNVASADSDAPDFQENFTGGGPGFGAGFPAQIFGAVQYECIHGVYGIIYRGL